MRTYIIDGIEVVEEKQASDGNESLCTCPSCGRLKLYINTNSGVYNCKTCELSGKADVHGSSVGTKTKDRKQKQKEETIDYEIVHIYIDKLVKSCKVNEYVRSYFLKKRIPIEFAEKFEVGYHRDPIPYDDVPVAKRIGLINEEGRDRFRNRIIFPVKNNGKYVYLTGRSVGMSSDIKFLDVSLPKRIFNADVIQNNQEIYLCEGIPDTISAISRGIENAVGILGAGVFKEEYISALVGKDVIICYDNDESGRINTSRVKRILEGKARSIKGINIPDEYDLADYFAEGNKSLNIIEISNIDSKENDLVFSRSEPNLLVFSYGHYQIFVKDVLPRRGCLRANVSIMNSSKLISSSYVDLMSIRTRSSFARDITQTTKDITLIESKTLLLNLLQAIQQNLAEIKDEPIRGKSYIMSDEEKEDAEKFLKSDKILFIIKDALERQECVGEENNKILLYLIYTSRLMRRPISCIIKGPSSSGKTYLMSKVLSLIPPEGYITIQQATAKSFYYMGENDLSHKMIVIGEMHGAEDSQYSIREAQEGIGDGKLTIATVEKDSETNQMKTVFREVLGPCGFVSSTTDVEINPENETRNFSVYVRIDEKKVIETINPIANRYTGNSRLLTKEELLKLHNAQRLLQIKLNVKIPYIRYVLNKFPTSPIRVMRDRVRFCVLIETIAILHQRQRKIEEDSDGNKWVIANLCDYNIALTLMDDILVETIFELPKKSKEIYEMTLKMRSEFVEESGSSFIDDDKKKMLFHTTYKKIGERMKLKSEEIRRWAKPLWDSGYFDRSEEDRSGGGRGKETKLFPIDKDFYQGFLPSPEEIANVFGMSGEKIYHPITGEEREISMIDVDL